MNEQLLNELNATIKKLEQAKAENQALKAQEESLKALIKNSQELRLYDIKSD